MKRYPKTLSNLLFYLLALAILPQAAHSAAYIKFDGIDGESKAVGHEGESDILSWCWGMSQTEESATGGGGGAGKVKFDRLSVTKEIDKATPLLYEKLASASPITGATLTVSKTSGDEPLDYLIITMKDVLISSVQVCDPGSSSGDSVPSEELSLNFTEIKVTYYPIGPDGRPGEPVVFSWNVELNEPGT